MTTVIFDRAWAQPLQISCYENPLPIRLLKSFRTFSEFRHAPCFTSSNPTHFLRHVALQAAYKLETVAEGLTFPGLSRFCQAVVIWSPCAAVRFVAFRQMAISPSPSWGCRKLCDESGQLL